MPVLPKDAPGKKKGYNSGREPFANSPASGPTGKIVKAKVRTSPSSSSDVKSVSTFGGLNQKSSTVTHTPFSKPKEDSGVKSFEEVLQQASGEKRHSNVRGKKEKLTAPAEEALLSYQLGKGIYTRSLPKNVNIKHRIRVIPTITNWPRWTTT